MSDRAHVLVIGSGVAGLASTLSAAAAGANVTLVAAGAELAERGGNTMLAQGGVAAAIGPDDDPALHAADTVAAGAGLVDPVAARVLTADGARAVRAIIADGFAVDRGASGAPIMGMEGAHSRHRIVHAGEDRSGATLHAYLRERVHRAMQDGRVSLVPGRIAERLIVQGGAVRGAVLRSAAGLNSNCPDAEVRGISATIALTADAVILATGGYAGLFPRSTNAADIRGEGLLLAASAGALLADLEFVQFHPTVIHGTGALVSEAVRGAGAVLRDGSGRQFMRDAHERGDLAPRDVVSREIHRVLRERGEHAVWLDATGIDALASRFPAITAAASTYGCDWTRDPIPVSPAAHYSMGGVATDLSARTSMPGLFAAGEVAATGVHGANRLASNSLLEGLVFGGRAGRAAAEFAARPDWQTGETFTTLEQELLVVASPAGLPSCSASAPNSPAHDDAATTVAAAIASGLGIVRDAPDLHAAAEVFATHAVLPAAQLAALIAAAATARTESRGAHQRDDYPQADPAQAVRRSIRALFPAEFPAEPARSTPQTAPHLTLANA